MTTVRVRVVEGTEVVIEVGPQFGVAAGVARRLRSEGINARQVRGEVHVDGDKPIEQEGQTT